MGPIARLVPCLAALALLPAAQAAARTRDLATTPPDARVHVADLWSGLTDWRGLVVDDLDGDGIDDLAVNLRTVSRPPRGPESGIVHVFFGPLPPGAAFDLSRRDGDLVILGPAEAKWLGMGLSTGDFNADGHVDLAVGAPSSVVAPTGSVGETFILFGPFSRGVRDMLTEPADVRIIGTTTDEATRCVSAYFGGTLLAGDFTGDCVDDLAIGSWGDVVPGRAGQPGTVQVVFGPMTAGQVVDLRASPADFTILGDNSIIGWVMAAGDVTGDHVDDMAFWPDGAMREDEPSRVVVFRAPLARGRLVDLATENADVTLSLASGSFGSGLSIGDVDGDGLGDLVVGAQNAGHAGGDRAGAVHAFLGPLTDATWDVSSRPADITVLGAHPSDRFGSSVLAADLTGDGIAEIVGASPYAEGAGGVFWAGSLATLVGPRHRGDRIDLAVDTPDDLIRGCVDSFRLATVLVAGDLNADGVGDLVASTWTSRETDVLVSELRPGPSGPLGDSDGDGVANACDACPLVADPEQLDGDGDGWGDACDHCGLGRRALARDEDGDGVADACDACVLGAAGLPEVSPLQVRVRKVPATRDLEIAFDASVVPDVVQHVNLVRGTIAAFRTPRRYDHGTEGGGACALVASPWIAGGGQDGGDAYFLVAGGCAQGAFEADGSHGRAWNRRARPERPTASELGTLDCP